MKQYKIILFVLFYIMGIYYGDRIFGVKITSDNQTLYEQMFEEQQITEEDKLNIQAIYSDLKNKCEEICLQVMVEYTCTIDSPPTSGRDWISYNILQLVYPEEYNKYMMEQGY